MRRDAGRWAAVEDLEYYPRDPDTHYTLFRNARARPRAWCAPDIVRATGPEALRAIRTGELPGGGTFDPATMVLVEPDDAVVQRGTTWGGPSEARQASPGGLAPRADAEALIELSSGPRYLVTTSEPCVLVLSEVHYPWWRATVDGTDVDAVRVNHAMIGLPVSAGSHVVRLRLEPRSVWTGGALSGISLLAWVGLLVAPTRRWPGTARRGTGLIM